MNLLFPLVAAAGASIAKVIDKLNISRNRISDRRLMLLIFSAMSLVLLIFVLLVRPSLPQFGLAAAGLTVLIIAVSFLANVFDYRSLGMDDLALREPVNDFQPVIAGFIGFLLFPAEREPKFLAALLIGAAVLYWGTHKIKMDGIQKKGMAFFWIATALYALLASIYKLTLGYMAPEYIALFRVVGILALSAIFFSGGLRGALTRSKLSHAVFSGVLYSAGTVAGLYSIQVLGLVLTMIFLMLGPALRYLLSWVVLKEKILARELGTSMVLSVVVLATVLI